MVNNEDLVVVDELRYSGDEEVLRLTQGESVRTFRQISAEVGTLPGTGPIDRYFPWVIVLRNAAQNASESPLNYQHYATDHKC